MAQQRHMARNGSQVQAQAMQAALPLKAISRMDRRTRWLIITTLASLVLMGLLFVLANNLARNIRVSSAPSLTEVLQGPHNLYLRVLPALDEATDIVLPATVGNYTLRVETIKVITPDSTLDTSGNSQITINFPTTHVVGQCVITSVLSYVPPCITSQTQYLALGTYQTEAGKVFDMVAAQFSSRETATETIWELRNYAGTMNSVGNYAIGLGDVDYFYSAREGQYTFTWAHGSWVYTIASTTPELLEELVKEFPY